MVCKSFFILCKYQHKRGDMSVNNVTIACLFPQFPTIHVSAKTIMALSYSELVYVLTSLQEKWHILVCMDLRAATKVIVVCMVRFCVLYCLQLSPLELDDMQERDKVVGAKHGDLYVMSKRATRHFVTTFMCMLRELVIRHGSRCVEVVNMNNLDKVHSIGDEVVRFGQTLPPNVSAQIQICFTKLKSIRNSCSDASMTTTQASYTASHPQECLLPQTTSEKPSDELLWAFLVKRIGTQKLGPAPRKISPAYSLLVEDVIVSLSVKYDNRTNLQVR